MPFTLEQFRDYIIDRAIKASQTPETKDEFKPGEVEGFLLCRNFLVLEDFEKALEEENKKLNYLKAEGFTLEDFWKQRHVILSIEFVYERMKVAYAKNVPGYRKSYTLSARAAQDYQQIITSNP